MALALLFGLRVAGVPRVSASLVAFDIAPRIVPPPPPPPVPQAPRPSPSTSARSAPKQAAAPRNLRNQAAAIVAPPVIPLIVPPPVAAAPVAGAGQAGSNGASNQAGPGQGAGGAGDGLGGGGNGGNGTGAGRPVVGPRRTGGRLAFADLPADALQPGQEAVVGVRYTVEPSGRVSACRAEQPSGYPPIDALTCRLIRERFVYRPAMDRDRNPVRSVIVETHSWYGREQGD